MLSEKKSPTNIGVCLGIVLQLAGAALLNNSDTTMQFIGVFIEVCGVGCFIWGCVKYGQGKGYPGGLGVLGVFGLCGFFVIMLLPDQHFGG